MILFAFFTIETSKAQENKVKISGLEGVAVVGYVDDGAFLNFSGPNISYKNGSSKIMLGMLPSLRFKDDKSTGFTNSVVTPALGLGLSYLYKRLVVQIPMYYNAKSATKNGTWVFGAGLGLKLQR
ncbi:MAG: hypothetical protein ACKOQ6_03685 [Bacteroidota bacterium]